MRSAQEEIDTFFRELDALFLGSGNRTITGACTSIARDLEYFSGVASRDIVKWRRAGRAMTDLLNQIDKDSDDYGKVGLLMLQADVVRIALEREARERIPNDEYIQGLMESHDRNMRLLSAALDCLEDAAVQESPADAVFILKGFLGANEDAIQKFRAG